MKTTSPIILLFLAFISFYSCSNGPVAQGKKFELPERTKVHRKVACKVDSSLSYAVYIPLKANKIIIAFDPHADGSLPVEKYRELAEKYGFIILGSNDSKNGIAPELIDRIVYQLYREARQVYAVDSSRIYLMGFSGGARIASLSAFYKIKVNGVIGCGAGFSGASAAPTYKADYFGIAGMGDFNMNEMLQLDYPLTEAKIRHVITTFSGIHEWPPVEIAESAFQWFELNGMKDGLWPKDNGLIDGIMSNFDSKTTKLIELGRYLEAASSCREAIVFGDGLLSVDKFRDRLASVESMPGFNIQKNYENNLMTREENERKALIDNLASKDLAWWKAFKLRMTSDKGQMKDVLADGKVLNMEEWKRRENQFMNQRIMAFVSLLAYMNATSVMTSMNEVAAVKIVNIYEIVDPENPEPYYLKAILAARKSDTAEALLQLDLAVSKGFKEKLRMAEQSEFAFMKENPGFFDILQKIK